MELISDTSPAAAAHPSAPAAGDGDTPRSTPRRRRDQRPPGESRYIGLLYIALPFLFFAVFVLLPLLNTVRLSFYEWNGLTDMRWVGLENYRLVAGDSDLRGSFVHSLVFVFFFSFLPVSIGLAVAALLARHRLRGMTFFRTILFLPQVVTSIVIGIAWKWMYASEGTVNDLLRMVGLESWTRAWLGDFDWALYAVGIIGTWVLYGFTMVLFLAGIQKIDPALYDAARIDGSGAIREFFAVTLPGLRGELAVALTLTMIAALKSFDLLFATTQGGPGTSTQVPAIAIYRLAFREGRIGPAAAIAVILVLIISTVVFAVNVLIRKPE